MDIHELSSGVAGEGFIIHNGRHLPGIERMLSDGNKINGSWSQSCVCEEGLSQRSYRDQSQISKKCRL